MAKKSSVEKNKRRQRMADKFSNKREALKKVIMDKETSFEDRLEASLKLAKLPRNSAPIRQRNRCEVSGRPRGYYRKLKMSRIALRELGSAGELPGIVKSSW